MFVTEASSCQIWRRNEPAASHHDRATGGEGDERKLEGETQKGNRHLKHGRCLTRYREQSGAPVFTPPSFHLVDTGMLPNVSALMTEN